MQHQHPGFLLVIEGIDGAGKSTQADMVAAALRQRGLQLVRSKEPTDGKWGRMLRASATTGRLPIEEELRAFLEDRKEHVATLIEPSLAQGKIVILDRYYFSTAAYQGARGIDFRTIIEENERFAPEPDLLVLLDIEPQSGRGRIHGRGDQANEFEKAESLKRARDIFLQIKKPYLLVLDARKPKEELCETIVAKTTRAMAFRTNRRIA
jgi:dTMP kinase